MIDAFLHRDHWRDGLFRRLVDREFSGRVRTGIRGLLNVQEFALAFTYFLMLLGFLVIRPGGLLGKEE